MISDEHWSLPPDRTTAYAGQFYRGGGWTSQHPETQTYELLSHHPCGFHLINVNDPTDRRCVSERAIGSVYYEMHEVPLHDMARRTSPAAEEARQRANALGGRARVYFRGGAYHVVPIVRAASSYGRHHREIEA